MKYKHFLIVSICISIVYVIGLYIINRKYNIVEKLGNFSGNYNSTANFTVHPKFVSTDTSTTFDGPLKIKTNSSDDKDYEYNMKLPCNNLRDDYIPASDTNKAYCKQTHIVKEKKNIYNVNDVTGKDYRLRFLGYWKNKEGDIYNIIKKKRNDEKKKPLLIQLEVINKKNNLLSLYKNPTIYNENKTNFEGTLVSPLSDVGVTLPYITFENLKNLNICAEGKKYSNDVCSHSLIKKTLDQKESDFLIWGGESDDLESVSSVKWYKTFDTENETDSYTINKDMEYSNNVNNIYDETSVDINTFNLNTECSIPCKNATNCNAFAYIPAPKNSLNYKGKCIFYNVDKIYDDLTFTLNTDTTLKKLSDHLVISIDELLAANKQLFDDIGVNDKTPDNKLSEGIVIIMPKKTKSNGTYLYELKNPNITTTTGSTTTTGN